MTIFSKLPPKKYSGLFSGQWLDGGQSWDQLCKQFGHLKLLVSQDYYSSFQQSYVQYTATFCDYIDLILKDTTCPLMCTEQLSPTQMLQSIQLPNLIKDRTTDPVSSYIFAGGKNRFSPLHFDWDFRNVLLHQIQGRKRVTVFPGEISKRLFPISNTSAISLVQMSASERSHFLATNNGLEFILEPGESLLMPKLCWHQVEYLEPSISINFRFEANRNERILATFPRNYRLQAICSSVPGLLECPIEQSAIAPVAACLFSPHSNLIDRYKALDLELRKLEEAVVPADQMMGEYLSRNMHAALLEHDGELDAEYAVTVTFKQPLTSSIPSKERATLVSHAEKNDIDIGKFDEYFSEGGTSGNLNYLEYGAIGRALFDEQGCPPFHNFICP